MITRVELDDLNPWFRHESAMQNEEKGSFLKGQIKIGGSDDKGYNIVKIEISLISNHESELHCNLLRIGGSQFKRNETASKSNVNGEMTCAMSPSSYKVRFIRDQDDKLIIDTDAHKSYLLPDIDNRQKSIPSLVDKSTKCLRLGEGGLHLTVIKTVEDGRRNNFVHFLDVLKRRYKEEQCPSYPQKCSDDWDCVNCIRFAEKKLCMSSMSKKLKRKCSNAMDPADEILNDQNNGSIPEIEIPNESGNLAYFMKNGGIHQGILKVETWLEKDSVIEKSVGYSELLFARMRFNIEIDTTCSDYAILDNASLYSLIIVLAKSGAVKSKRIDAQFVYRHKSDKFEVERDVSTNEISIINIFNHPVRRVGAKGDTLQIFFRASKGTTLASASQQEYILSIILKLVDNNGFVGNKSKLDLECYPHECTFDQDLKAVDKLYDSFNHKTSLQRNPRCLPCTMLVQKARKQYRKIHQLKHRVSHISTQECPSTTVSSTTPTNQPSQSGNCVNIIQHIIV